MRETEYRGYRIRQVADAHFVAEHLESGARLSSGVGELQLRHSIDHFLDRDCGTHRRCRKTYEGAEGWLPSKESV